jgi:hypothetical protein
MTEDFVIKYFWSAIGYGLMSIPIFYPAIGKAVVAGQVGEHEQVAARAEGELPFVPSSCTQADDQATFPTGVFSYLSPMPVVG